jgi:mRNA-degrading endonuclease RelE of RelBE toxin-antitoxin system
MKIFQMPKFKKFAKKLPRHLQQVLLDAVEDVISQTDIGELKKGDLSGFRVHKFTMDRQLILLAYKVDSESLTFYQAGPHENFYKNLKKYIQKNRGSTC